MLLPTGALVTIAAAAVGAAVATAMVGRKVLLDGLRVVLAGLAGLM